MTITVTTDQKLFEFLGRFLEIADIAADNTIGHACVYRRLVEIRNEYNALTASPAVSE